MSRLSGDLFRGFGGARDERDAEARSRRANRRRLVVFASTFVGLAFVGLVWVFSRPAIYEATARLDFVPVANADAAAGATPYALRDEIQYLTSRTLLTRVWADLEPASVTPAALRAGDPPATLQSMLEATQVPGTNIVSVAAHGGDPAFLAAFVERLLADYRASLDERFKGGSTTALADASDEAAKLDAAVTAKRLEVDAFRAKNNIVSLERDENQVLSEVKGTGAALNAANEKVVSAQAKVDAVKAAQAAGKTVVRARDNPTLASLEQQAIAIRADLRATARQFTQAYMDIDPRVREQRARLADIEEQMTAVRRDSQQGALQDALEELAGAQERGRGAASAARVEPADGAELHVALQRIPRAAGAARASRAAAAEGGRPAVGARRRRARTQAEGRGRRGAVDPAVAVESAVRARRGAGRVRGAGRRARDDGHRRVLQPAAEPAVDRRRPADVRARRHDACDADGAVLFSRHARTAVVGRRGGDTRDARTAGVAVAARARATTRSPRCCARPTPSSAPSSRCCCRGLSAGETVRLRHADIDRGAGLVHVGGDEPRSVPLPPNVVAWLPSAAAADDGPLFGAPGGRPLAEETVATALLYAAHDAGLDDADDVTPDCLRHTFIAFLVRRGLRFTELARLVGSLPPARLAAYRELRTAPSDRHADPVERALPALRGFVA